MSHFSLFPYYSMYIVNFVLYVFIAIYLENLNLNQVMVASTYDADPTRCELR